MSKIAPNARLETKLRHILLSRHHDLKRSITITLEGLHVQMLERNKEKRTDGKKSTR